MADPQQITTKASKRITWLDEQLVMVDEWIKRQKPFYRNNGRLDQPLHAR